MPVIKRRTHRVPVVRHISRLTLGNRDVLIGYAEMLGDDADYVLNQLVERLAAGAIEIKPRVRRIRKIRHSARLAVTNRDHLVAYAKRIGDTTDYVLNQLIEQLAKDPDFRRWREQRTTDAEPTARPGSASNESTSRS